ncbi:MAG: HIT domain-containing protein, partial [Candidatus Omnitrophica bacterium]|nr:HIT domain-containing protein [Candidatus Omnitrophota bacterium]
MSADCVFCQITQHQIPAKIVWENTQVVAFQDINPQAPIHVVLAPKTHIARISDVNESNASTLKDLVLAANELAKT